MCVCALSGVHLHVCVYLQIDKKCFNKFNLVRSSFFLKKKKYNIIFRTT